MERSRLTDLGCAGLLAGFSVLALILLAVLTPREENAQANSTVAGLPPGANMRPGAPGKKPPPKPRPKQPTLQTWFSAPERAEAVFRSIPWEPVFTDRFERDELGENWSIDDGTWYLEDGKLHCEASVAAGHDIVCTAVKFKAPFKITYRAHASEKAVIPVDLSLMTHNPGMQRISNNSGYLYQIGGWENSFVGISTNKHWQGMVKNTDLHIIPGKVHTIEAYCHENWLMLKFDGKIAAAGYVDEKLDLPGYEHGGFYVFRGPSWFDDLVVYKPREGAELPPPADVPKEEAPAKTDKKAGNAPAPRTPPKPEAGDDGTEVF
ncbi:MAG: hypothetical protein ACOCX4_04550 [Planctomycetota bacterium]